MVEHLTKDTFIKKIYNYEDNNDWKYEGDDPSVLKLTASWCGPCRVYKPIFEKIASEYQNVNFYEIDVDDEPEITQVLGIRSVPTTIFISKQGEKQLSLGSISQDRLRTIVKDL
jgi:thiol-disulfide isomerase/thioredoxin